MGIPLYLSYGDDDIMMNGMKKIKGKSDARVIPQKV
jgi:hypothetical protein